MHLIGGLGFSRAVWHSLETWEKTAITIWSIAKGRSCSAFLYSQWKNALYQNSGREAHRWWRGAALRSPPSAAALSTPRPLTVRPLPLKTKCFPPDIRWLTEWGGTNVKVQLQITLTSHRKNLSWIMLRFLGCLIKIGLKNAIQSILWPDVLWSRRFLNHNYFPL